MTEIKRKIEHAVITGPTGAIGRALIRELTGRGIRVTAVVRPESTRAEELLRIPGVSVAVCPLSGLDILPEKIHSADAFFHFAWDKTTGAGRNDMPAQIENIRGAVMAAQAAAAMNCQVFIGAGSQAEYGRPADDGDLTPETPCFPENGYGMAKLCAGEMTRVLCEGLGVDHIWMRILSVYGPYDSPGSMIMSTIAELLSGKKPAVTKGEQQWDYLYSADAAEAFYLAAVSGQRGKVYTLGGGTAQLLREYVEEIRNAIDPSLPLGIGEVPYSPQQVMHLCADISALSEDTGFHAKTAFADGIRETIDYVKQKQLMQPYNLHDPCETASL